MPSSSPAFTLVEMLVSLAVLGLALAVVGVVFTVTVDTTRQAAAYSEAQNWLRQFMLQLEEDLEHCNPASSVLVLVGRTQAAALTQEDLAAGKYYRVLVGDPTFTGGFDPDYYAGADPATNQYSDPRADIIMFFTSRPTVSQAPPENFLLNSFGEACASGVKFAPIQVVYGHAAFDAAVYNGSEYEYAGNLRHIEQTVSGTDFSIIPASEWHLSRRAVILRNPSQTTPMLPDDIQFLQRARENIVYCRPDNDGWEEMPGDGARFNLPLFLEQLGPDTQYAPTDTNYWLPPYSFNPLGNALWDSRVAAAITAMLYGADANSVPNHHVATVVENPPAELATNLGVHLLPGCAWFQVEFLMPEDPRNSLEYDDPTPNIDDQYSERTDMPRWTEVNSDPALGPTTYVFVPDTAANREKVSAQVDAWGAPQAGSRLADFAMIPKIDALGQPQWVNNVESRRVRMWPYAIRITVRVFDPRGRLAEPLVRSIVHRFD